MVVGGSCFIVVAVPWTPCSILNVKTRCPKHPARFWPSGTRDCRWRWVFNLPISLRQDVGAVLNCVEMGESRGSEKSGGKERTRSCALHDQSWGVDEERSRKSGKRFWYWYRQ